MNTSTNLDTAKVQKKKIEHKHSKGELMQYMSLDLESKVRMAKSRIRGMIEYAEENQHGIYVSFSGGLDSRVTLDITREVWQEYTSAPLPVLFADTWFEYPSLRRFVYDMFKGHEDEYEFHVVKPDMLMKEIIAEYGWLFPSKEVSSMIWDAKRGKQWALNKLRGLDGTGEVSEYRSKRFTKWTPLYYQDEFIVSPFCCEIMKEKPCIAFEKENSMYPILGLRACESQRRLEAWCRTGCNAFDSERPLSKPISFFTRNDILQYHVTRNLSVAPPYGKIVLKGEAEGQMMLDTRFVSYDTSGEKRTGCLFCPCGSHLDNFAKYVRLRETEPKLYRYVMDELGLRDVLIWIQKNYSPSSKVVF